MGQLDACVAVGGDDLCPGDLVTSQPLRGKDRGHVPAKDGCHVAALDLKGRRKVARLHCNLLMGHSWRRHSQSLHTSYRCGGGLQVPYAASRVTWCIFQRLQYIRMENYCSVRCPVLMENPMGAFDPEKHTQTLMQTK